MKQYKEGHGSFPLSLTTEVLQGNTTIDPYGNQVRYTTEGSSYTVTSYARDQRPGGDMYDTDIVVTDGDWPGITFDISRAERGPAYVQFWKIRSTKISLYMCAIIGGLSFLVAVAGFWKRDEVELDDRLAALVIIFFAACFAAFFLSMFHVPTNH